MSSSKEELENVKQIASKIIKKYLAWLKSSVFEETFKMLLASEISIEGDFAFSSEDIKNISKFVALGKDYLEKNDCDWMNRFRMLTKDQQYAVVRHQQFSYFLKIAKKPTLTCRNFEYRNYKAKIHHKDKCSTSMKDAIYTLPYFRKKFKDDSCAVCIEKFTEGQFVLKLPCHHAFHLSCMSQWNKRRTTCPTCRRKLAVKSEITYDVKLEKMKDGSTNVEIHLQTESLFY